MGGFVPGCGHDLFISYAHADDTAWIQAFEKSLREALQRQLGLGVTVWQDGKQLRAGQNWQEEIESGVKGAAVFVAVLSPSYENSDWCARERRLFTQIFTPEEPFETSNRFYKVLKTPWDNDGHRHFLEAIQSLDFFRPEEGTEGDLEFVPGSDDFRKGISSLAQAIERTLRQIRRKRERVFVASPTDDCLDVWNQLRDELLRTQGYDVQPPGRRDEAYGDVLIRDEMKDALLSVHLLGASFDRFTERQIRLAADLEQRLLFWLSPAAEVTADADQARLIDLLTNGRRPDPPHAPLPPQWTLLRSLTPRRLIDEILASLKPRQAPAQASAAGAPRVYIVHDATTDGDTRIAADLREQIVRQERMEVYLSRADLASATDLRQRHEKLMQTCDGILLCRNAAPREWLMQLAPEVSFAERLFQRPPPRSRGFLVSDPGALTGLPNFRPILYGPQFRIGDLEPFLAPLRPPGSSPHGS